MKILILINLVLASILVGLLTSCQGPKTFVMADGTKFTQTGHVGGKDFTQLKKTPAGGWTFTSRSDMEKSFSDGVTAGVAAYSAFQYGLTQRAEQAADVAIATGAQKAATDQAGIAAGVAEAGIAADVTKTITIPK